MPGIDEEYEIFSAMKTDGSDPVNATFVAAGSTSRPLSASRWIPARCGINHAFVMANTGSFSSVNSFFVYNYVSCVAAYDVGE